MAVSDWLYLTWHGLLRVYLAGHLEVEELLQVPLVGGVGGIDLVLLVVGLDEVLSDGARLPQGEVVVVGVDNGGEATIGVDLAELFILGVLNVNLLRC